MPSGPSHTAPSGAEFRPTSNITTLPTTPQSALGLAKSVAPLLTISLPTQTLTTSPPTDLLGASLTTKSLPSFHLTLLPTEKSYKTLKRFARKGDNIAAVFEHCVKVDRKKEDVGELLS